MPSTITSRLNGLTTSVAVKAPCRAATTANITLSGEQTIDGVAVVAGDRVLVKNQSSSVDNGIYVVATGSWSRATDFDGSLDAVGGTQVYVFSGTINTNTYWRVDGIDTSITVGTDAVDFEPAGLSDSATHTFLQTGGGAVSRTVQARLRDWVSVFDFIPVAEHAGIIANTTTSADDFTAYIQDALDTGKNVFVPNGTYWVDGTPANALSPANGQTIHLEAGATLKVIPNGLDTYYAIDLTGLSNVTIEGHGEIVGERGSHTGPTTDEHGFGIACLNATNIVVRDLRFRDFYGDGIYVGGTGVSGQSVNVLIDNVTSDNNYRNALSITSVNGCWVRGGKFTGSTGLTGAMCGIDVEPNSGKPNVENVLLDGVICTDNDGPGISVSQPTAINVTVRNPICVDNGGDGLSIGITGLGMVVEGGVYSGNGDSGIHAFGESANALMNLSIRGVRVFSNTLDGIQLDGNVLRWTIEGFNIYLNGRHGISAERTAGSYMQDSLIKGGHVFNNSQTTDLAADNVYLGTGCRFVIVKDNVVRANTPTSLIAGSTSTPSNRTRYGINVVDNHASITIESNDLTAGGITAAALTQALNRVRNNIGYSPVGTREAETLVINVGDETTALTTGTAKVTFRMPYAMTLLAVKASVTTAPTDAVLTVDINEGGTTILSTKLTIDSGEKTSATAATAAVISDSALAADAEMTIDIDQIGSTVAGAGLKVYLTGVKV